MSEEKLDKWDRKFAEVCQSNGLPVDYKNWTPAQKEHADEGNWTHPDEAGWWFHPDVFYAPPREPLTDDQITTIRKAWGVDDNGKCRPWSGTEARLEDLTKDQLIELCRDYQSKINELVRRVVE